MITASTNTKLVHSLAALSIAHSCGCFVGMGSNHRIACPEERAVQSSACSESSYLDFLS